MNFQVVPIYPFTIYNGLLGYTISAVWKAMQYMNPETWTVKLAAQRLQYSLTKEYTLNHSGYWSFWARETETGEAQEGGRARDGSTSGPLPCTPHIS